MEEERNAQRLHTLEASLKEAETRHWAAEKARRQAEDKREQVLMHYIYGYIQEISNSIDPNLHK